MADERRAGSVAEVFDSVRWDYDPESGQLSPLVSTEHYFRDFPWEPEEIFGQGEEPAEASGERSGS